MADQIDSNALVPAEEVGNIHRETFWERLLRMFPTIARALMAIILTSGGMAVCIVVVFSDKPDLHDLRNSAWTLFAAIVAGGTGFLFGTTRSPDP
jgi:hypothetical protein